MNYSVDDFIIDYNSLLANYSLTGEQEKVVRTIDGPVLVSAGPGSGKTECLVARTLRLLVVEGARSDSIILTTFTRKAARQLLDRLSFRLVKLKRKRPDIQQITDVDLTGIRIGTVHGIAEGMLADSRTQSFNGMTVIDPIQLRMLLVNTGDQSNIYAPRTHPLRIFNQQHFGNPPPWEGWVNRLTSLMNRITEDQIDLDKLADQGGEPLIDSYEWYRNVMKESRRLDFALLIEMLLSELKLGTLEEMMKSIEHVMVDEYQDTNPIQEDIFFSLARNTNLCVVGDDDQSLYRFRGASVECMIRFDQECVTRWDLSPKKFSIIENFRSHPQILDFYEEYMNSHTELNIRSNRLREKGQPPLLAKGPTLADHSSVILCQGADKNEADYQLSEFINNLEGIVEDWSQVAILSPSVREDTKDGIGNLVRLLEERGIPVFNPRGKNMAETEEVMTLFGLMSMVLDEFSAFHDILNPKFDSSTIAWIEESRLLASRMMSSYEQVGTYVENGRAAIANADDKTAYPLLGVMFHIINLEPFVEWEVAPASAWRLSQATKWLEGYSRTPSGRTRTPAFLNLFVESGEISLHQLNGFYKLACKTIVEERTVEHEEEDEVDIPGHISVMTIHQAKGLEFDIVIAYGLCSRNSPSHRMPAVMHSFFAPLRKRELPVSQTVDQLRDFDSFRAHFVAFSRAKHALVLHDPDSWSGRPHQRGHFNENRISTREYIHNSPKTEVVR